MFPTICIINVSLQCALVHVISILVDNENIHPALFCVLKFKHMKHNMYLPIGINLDGFYFSAFVQTFWIYKLVGIQPANMKEPTN